ncbi:MAG: hypothetical protein U0L49_05845 [Eubacterium sp.]|nr:hypothetical protein [Eubacterium sp.]
MEANISKSLIELYKSSKKNIDRALSMFLDSMDPDCYEKTFEQIQLVSNKKEESKEKVKLGDSVTGQIKEAFGKEKINDGLIETLMWVAVLFPEI